MQQLEKSHNNQQSRTSLQVVKKVSESTDQEITSILGYVISLLGVPADKIPTGINRTVMITYIRDKWANKDLNEIKTAFDWAIETGYDLNLYARLFNVEFIKSVILAYRLSKQKPKSEEPNIYNRAGIIVDLLKNKCPETYNKITGIGKEKQKIEFEPTQRSNDIFQIWMRQFDNLKRKYCYNNWFIKIGDTIFDNQSFLQRKLDNYNK